MTRWKGRESMSNRIPEEVLQDIRESTNIVDVVGQYVQLKKSGKNYFGLCPFHEEKSPSFSVVEDKQIFHCFGCGKGGNVFRFIEEIEGYSFPQAVEKVAEMSHLTVEYQFDRQEDREVSPERRLNQRLVAIHQRAADVYHHLLMNTQMGEAALDYLESRGMTHDQLTHFQVGLAPNQREFLEKILVQEGFNSEELKASGLFSETDDGRLLDRFFGRIMFPIHNDHDQVIAFSGRLFEEQGESDRKSPKYLNSPETSLFNKRNVLYNHREAKKIARKTGEIILFEGFMDVIAAWGADVQNGVASMGTSLTNEQIQMLKKSCSKLLICYDGDSAGLNASMRALEVLEAQRHFDVNVMKLPNEWDPDEFIKREGAERFQNFIKNQRQTPFSFKTGYYETQYNLQTEQGKLDFIQKVLQELSKVSSVVERDLYIQQIAKDYELTEDAIRSDLSQYISSNRASAKAKERRENRTRDVIIENQVVSTPQNKVSLLEKTQQMLLYRMMTEEDILRRFQMREDFSFLDVQYQEIFNHLIDFKSSYSGADIGGFLDYVKEDYLKKLIVTIMYLEMSEESNEQEIVDYERVFKRYRLLREITELEKELVEVQKNGDIDKQLTISLSLIDKKRQLDVI